MAEPGATDNLGYAQRIREGFSFRSSEARCLSFIVRQGMGSQSHQRFLEDAAVREARRVFDVERRPATLSSFLALRVQTVEPWKRIACVLLGLLFGTLAAWLADEHQAALWAAGFFGIVAVFAVAVGAIGWKRPVEAVLNATAELVFRRILDVL